MIEKFVVENWPLIAVAFVSGGMLVWPLVGGARNRNALTTLQATQLINSRDAVLIDVRDQADYSRSHIVNAKNFPAKVFEDRKAELEKLKSTPVIVHCATGQSSTAAAEKLKTMGLTEVFTLAGGLAAWRDAGLPVTSK